MILVGDAPLLNPPCCTTVSLYVRGTLKTDTDFLPANLIDPLFDVYDGKFSDMDGEVTIAVPIEGPNNFKIEVECLG